MGFWIVVLETITASLLLALFGTLYRVLKKRFIAEQDRRDLLIDLTTRVERLENAGI